MKFGADMKIWSRYAASSSGFQLFLTKVPINRHKTDHGPLFFKILSQELLLKDLAKFITKTATKSVIICLIKGIEINY